MKVLLSITSWLGAATNGENQAARDTFLKDVPKFSGLEHRFFIGNGEPTGEDETALFASFDLPWWCNSEYKARALAVRPGASSTYQPRADEVLLPVPDDYAHLACKFKAACRWALNSGFDFMFQTAADIYVDVPRLMASGFENHDHIGRGNGYHPGVDGELVNGGGYWVSRKLMNVLVNTPVNVWAEDVWVSSVVARHGLLQRIDWRYSSDYCGGGAAPNPSNDIISVHLGPNTPKSKERYDVALMYKVHEGS